MVVQMLSAGWVSSACVQMVLKHQCRCPVIAQLVKLLSQGGSMLTGVMLRLSSIHSCGISLCISYANTEGVVNTECKAQRTAPT